LARGGGRRLRAPAGLRALTIYALWRVRVSRSEQQAVVERFLAALRTGRLQELMEVMAPDVVLIADGGGLAAAALAPVHGAELVATVLAREQVRVHGDGRVAQRRARGPPRGRREPATVNLVVEDGRVTQVYLVRNPRKRRGWRTGRPRQVSRKKSTYSSPLSTYSAPGGLPQDPGRAT